jgi:hypothetical protein
MEDVGMATFSRVPMEEAQRAAMPPRRAAEEQYREDVRALTPDLAGRLELGPDDRPVTERARLKAAAKAEGINLEIQRTGNTIVFWETNEPPKAQTRATGGGRRGRPKRR